MQQNTESGTQLKDNYITIRKPSTSKIIELHEDDAIMFTFSNNTQAILIPGQTLHKMLVDKAIELNKDYPELTKQY